MADPTLAEVLAAVEQQGDDIKAAMAHDRAAIMSSLEGMEGRQTALMRNLGANCRHVDYVDQKVDNLRDEMRLGGRTMGEIMAVVRVLEARVAKLVQGKGLSHNNRFSVQTFEV